MSDDAYVDQTHKYRELLHSIAEKNGVEAALLLDLIEYEKTKVHMERRRGAKETIRKTIEQWIEEAKS